MLPLFLRRYRSLPQVVRQRPLQSSSIAPRSLFHRNGASSRLYTTQSAPPPELPSWANTPRWRRALVSAIIGVKLIAFTHLIVSKVLIISQCEGASMLPTLPGTVSTVIINNMYSRGRGVRVGDLITAHRPDDIDIMMLKRVIGMPGDYVVVDPIAAGLGEETMMVRVPEGHCWVTGDNLQHSIDSRFYGPLPLALVMGKVIAQVSWREWTWFTGGPYSGVAPGG
ncbi:hypothetical protein ABW21_db0204313 [Orbilia brochopaga]|nr:hypothetical protein ABW21_db0204313 [Drechslerella brochopaga]